jgi:hypothetical protein
VTPNPANDIISKSSHRIAYSIQKTPPNASNTHLNGGL